MKRHSVAIALLLLAASATAQAMSDEGVYFGIKGGFMDPDQDQLDSAINIGGVLGYTLPGVKQLNGLVGIEGEITLSAIQGDVTGGGEWDVQTLAGYGTYRSAGAAYFLGKAGIAHQRLNVDPGTEADDTSFAWGIGGGLKMGQGRAEVEYTWLEDMNFISLAYLF